MRIFLFCFLAAAGILHGQSIITFDNPGFEDEPRHSSVPWGWTNCGPAGESPPDVHPDFVFGVTKSAYSGKTYLGMVTRDNATWESVGTELSAPLLRGQCYTFDIALVRAPSYLSISRVTNAQANYTSSTKLRVWGGTASCDRAELLAESEPITSLEWEVHSFEIAPQQEDYTHIVLEAYYGVKSRYATNGNLMLDGASAFKPCNSVPTTPAVAATARPKQVRLPHTFGTTNPAFDPFYWSGVLTDVAFGDDHAPVQYALDVRLHDGSPLPNANGELPRHNPALYTLARALPLADKGWTLVVRHHDPAVAQRRTEWVAAQLLDLAAPITTTRPYSAAQDDQTVWDAKSVTSGMYLKRNAP